MSELDFITTDEGDKGFKELQKLTGKDKTWLINYAISLFTWADRESRRGRSVVSMDPNTLKYKTVEMPGLKPRRRKPKRKNKN